ncbi:MAG: hypothetical protein M3463_21730, partial [Verrucomicrobiota bacterium]|nr:hypothetical protein [Verrucomicrobiota bacterium]
MRARLGQQLAAALLTLSLLSAAPAQEPAAPPGALAVLVQTLGRIENPAAQANILRGLNASLKGKQNLGAPPGWNELYEKLKASPNEEVRRQAQMLAATFGGGAALEEMRRALADATAGLESRKAALDSLVAAKDHAALPALLSLAPHPGPLRAAALRGLNSYDDPRVAPALIEAYASLDSNEKREALNTLLTRAADARALLKAIDEKRISRSEITAPLARQLMSFRDAGIDAWMKKEWGAVRSSSADKQKEIAKYKQFLTTDLILRGDAPR